MTYKYCRIYNVTKGKYAYDVSGDDDVFTIWENNDWDEDDALVGYYTDDNDDYKYDILYCKVGYTIYVLPPKSGSNTYEMDDNEYRVPPAILINLESESDSEFLHSKNYPDISDSEMDCDEDEDSESESEDDEEESEQMDCEESDTEEENEEELSHTVADIVQNQPVIDFLERCRSKTNNPYKKQAYTNAINEAYASWAIIDRDNYWLPNIGPSISRKIREFLEGVPEDDILHS
jgi:hypothetical protein